MIKEIKYTIYNNSDKELGLGTKEISYRLDVDRTSGGFDGDCAIDLNILGYQNGFAHLSFDKTDDELDKLVDELYDKCCNDKFKNTKKTISTSARINRFWELGDFFITCEYENNEEINEVIRKIIKHIIKENQIIFDYVKKEVQDYLSAEEKDFYIHYETDEHAIYVDYDKYYNRMTYGIGSIYDDGDKTVLVDKEVMPAIIEDFKKLKKVVENDSTLKKRNRHDLPPDYNKEKNICCIKSLDTNWNYHYIKNNELTDAIMLDITEKVRESSPELQNIFDQIDDNKAIVEVVNRLCKHIAKKNGWTYKG